MNNNLDCLIDPRTAAALQRKDSALRSSAGAIVPIVRGIPRFVDEDGNYSEDFGAQWNRFPHTQLDSFSGLDISEKTGALFSQALERAPRQTRAGTGSGAGRFTEILLKHGAIVHSFDYSNAVDANAKNNGASDNLVLVQADIRQIPFQPASYDFVMCLGVLQHTPNPEESLRSLWTMLKPGGALVVDHYVRKWRIVLPPPIGQALGVYRQLILRLPKQRRFACVKALTDFWFPWHWKFRDSWLMTRILRRLSPVIFHYPDIILADRSMYYDWALLDTHDSTTDVYKHYRTPAQLRRCLEALGGKDIVVSEGGNGIEAFCRK